MTVTLEHKKKIINLTKEMSEDKLKELVDFAQFLNAKKEEFTYGQVKNSSEYVRQMRIKEVKKVKSGKRFIEELIEWQKSNS